MSATVQPHDKGLLLSCTRCGQTLDVEEPVEARRFFAALKAFLTVHENCAPRTTHGTH